ncbi:MAG: ribonucleoside-diphosphate reductase subunit alpha [Planctomycetes bacterium]|nr:ribonucleoside-diphosphate reductase subunit alpha [Planctomycetota bacterium]
MSTQTQPAAAVHPISDLDAALFSLYRVRARDGSLRPFDPERIARALAKAKLAADGGEVLAQRARDLCALLCRQVCEQLRNRRPEGGAFDIEEVQDQVELAMMRAGEHESARRFVLYRESRRQARASEPAKKVAAPSVPAISVLWPDGTKRPLDHSRLVRVIGEACTGLSGVSAELLLKDTLSSAFDGMPYAELGQALVLAARMRIEEEPNYTYAAARLLLDDVREQAVGRPVTQSELQDGWTDYFASYIQSGIDYGIINKELASFDLKRLADACVLDRDNLFMFQGLQILADRYFIHIEGRRIELPQAFWMRVAMGLAAREVNREEVAISFYEQLSTLRYVSSTPTLFNAGCVNQQLSSCFLTTIGDDLGDIFKAIRDDALLSKFSGGLGNDWTPVRALGSHIKGTNGKSQGVIPFMKVANDTAVAVNQGGKRKGAICAYLETWHLDIEEFLDLRKNTGDDRRRTHDMNTANWVPDLFLERVEADGDWTLFTPNEVPDLHDTYGNDFRAKYEAYEAMAKAGTIKVTKTLKAVHLWRKMLGMVFETGHPWITFKDPCNLRSPQQHAGVVHSSNLCTEITLNTSKDETAVCNLGSINLAAHTTKDGLDLEKLQETVSVAMRMLDNVIDINLYNVAEARRSNLRHRPVGLGLMGFQDALYVRGLAYASDAAVQFADESMEAISYYAILASSKLAKERGPYASYAGSLWSKGILPIDSIKLLADARKPGGLQQDTKATLDWAPVRAHVAEHGMRNSNCLAIAPTATISNIIGVSQSIEPMYQNLYVKSNMSGDFTVINMYLVDDLKARGLWDRQMADDLKYYDGSCTQIARIPDALKAIYATAFEVSATWLIDAASRRQKWIDQAQSLNLYMKEPSGKKLDEMYRYAWKTGCKTTYYLRSQGATHVEKSTSKSGALNAVPTSGGIGAAPTKGGSTIRGSSSSSSSSTGGATAAAEHTPAQGVAILPEGALAPKQAAPKVCSILDPGCEACQ